ncbi:hypothetical protein CERZMDRAFT_103295 [Cercospora zeae-maydis SCOH1-5]|uniref:Uncharacterized protein n=1 Tax=Cercospora zeae-maydis SCOH1-5 TaxID=717836 RepID=A0A6A6EZF5_9PEZI|nr:hypothetical protein CERZMDRAFT_103295 [Cercospora zeae-maydis SCOH1-5]
MKPMAQILVRFDSVLPAFAPFVLQRIDGVSMNATTFNSLTSTISRRHTTRHTNMLATTTTMATKVTATTTAPWIVSHLQSLPQELYNHIDNLTFTADREFDFMPGAGESKAWIWMLS